MLTVNKPSQRLLKILGLSLITALSVQVEQVNAAALTFFNKTEFLNAINEPINLESFEGLPPDIIESEHNTITLADFTLSVPAPDTNLSIEENMDGASQAATDGVYYVKNRRGQSLTFSFSQALNFFGIHIIDWGDLAEEGALTLTTDQGDTFEIANVLTSDNLGSGNVLFFGLIADQPFKTLTLNQPSSDEVWSVDEVYYGATTSVPESSLLLGLMGIGMLGMGAILKRN